MSDWIASAKKWVNENFVFFLILTLLGIALIVGIAKAL